MVLTLYNVRRKDEKQCWSEIRKKGGFDPMYFVTANFVLYIFYFVVCYELYFHITTSTLRISL